MNYIVEFAFQHCETVTHVCDESARGMIVGRTDHGGRQEYRVQWGIEKCIWHLKEELRAVSDGKQIGFKTV